MLTKRQIHENFHSACPIPELPFSVYILRLICRFPRIRNIQMVFHTNRLPLRYPALYFVGPSKTYNNNRNHSRYRTHWEVKPHQNYVDRNRHPFILKNIYIIHTRFESICAWFFNINLCQSGIDQHDFECDWSFWQDLQRKRFQS